MKHVDLVMLEHRVEEGGEGRNQANPEGIYEDRDLSGCPCCASVRRGQATISPHSLKLEASMGRTLSMASLLSTRGRPSAGSKDGGTAGRDRGFFPF